MIKLEKLGVYFGDPSENKIIGSGDMYVVIHNPTELALTVMKKGADKYCKQTLGDHYASNFMKLLGKYTSFFSCSITNKIIKYNLSEQERICIEDIVYENEFVCTSLNEKNSDIIKEINFQKTKEEKYKTNDFIYTIRYELYDQIINLENFSEEKRIKNKGKLSRDQTIQKHINICKNYSFEEGSLEFFKCLLELIKLDHNYLIN